MSDTSIYPPKPPPKPQRISPGIQISSPVEDNSRSEDSSVSDTSIYPPEPPPKPQRHVPERQSVATTDISYG